MDKDTFKKNLAEHGYNVLFGAKKHFATYDIVEKFPNMIALVTLIIGIWQIYDPSFQYNKQISLLIILVSVIALHINQYNAEKENYMEVGKRLIQIHNELKDMYYKIDSAQEITKANEYTLNKLLKEYYDISITKQIILSDWYAHYKFFAQAQYEWIDEQKGFTWKDKFPMSLRIWIIIVIIITSILVIKCWR